ncbi:hypothetical protein EU537_05345, partial [Candidatus Thorarchaeota archaeon]
LSMDIGELDGTPGDEIALVAQGQGVFTLDWNPTTKTYDYKKVYRDYEEWETFGLWGLDFWADSVIEANNVTYYDPLNASIVEPEPIEYVWGGSYFIPDASVYPYNTGMASYTDGNYSTFDASLPGVDNATAIVDFGLDEEGTGSANAAADLIIRFKNTLDSDIFTHFNFSVSQDGRAFEQVTSDHFDYTANELEIDVDTALARRKWDWFRYVKISVFDNALYEINSLELLQVYNTITEALSVSIGQLRFDGDAYVAGDSELDKIVVGTVIGEFHGIGWEASEDRYRLLWESGDDDYYTFGANVWAMEHVPLTPNTPTWNLELGNFMTPQPATTYNSWAPAILDPSPYGTNTATYLMGTQEGQVYAYYQNPATPPGETAITLDPVMQPYVDDINTWLSGLWQYTSAEGANLDSPSTNLPMIAVGVYNPDVPLDEGGALTRARVYFFWRDSVSTGFNHRVELWEIDETGELSQLINLAKTTPKMDFFDFDGDGDQDFVVGNGKVYLAKNLYEETGVLQFSHVRGHFDDINLIETSALWGQPDMADLDGDGDFDIVLSYGNKKGATCFFNEGDDENPVWVEDKKVFSNPGETTNMKLLNLTDVRIVQDYGGFVGGFSLERHYEYTGQELQADYTMASYNDNVGGLYWCAPRFDTTDTFIVASYPKVAQMEFSLMERDSALFFNLGYHIHESWSNEDDLEGWTMCIASADTDNDGNGEIIVGDYDNNVYIFEHLTNNTYKRMFRSFDLNHTEESDVSPYYYEELEGISGDFKRKVWDHAEHLIADVDLDQDGLKEIVVAAHLQIYIFEELGLTGGDALRFAYSFDLRDTDWVTRPEFDQVEKITTMAAGDDLDYDGRLELAVAAGPFLFIYNIDEHSFIGMEDNEFFVTSKVLEGRYSLLGNPLFGTNEFARINAMTLCDTDKDGYREVIIGGIEDIRLLRENGFVYIYESQGGTFKHVWSAPPEVTTWNPISVLMLDDQDYDGEQEIIIGHTHGFDMWEHIPGTDSQYQKVEYVTASPNYPIVPQASVFYPSETYGGYNRYHADIAHLASPQEDYMFMVYTNNTYIGGKFYEKPTDTWGGGGNLSASFNYGGVNIVEEYRPSFTVDPLTNDYYFAWEAKSGSGTHYIAWTYYDSSASTWSPVTLLQDQTSIPFTRRYHPSIIEVNNTHMGIVYRYTDSFFASGGRVGCRIFPKGSPSSYAGVGITFANRDDLSVHDVDAVKLGNGDIAIAMTAVNTELGKVDHDIWVLVGNDQMDFTGKYAHQATSSYLEEMYPSIDYLRSDDASIVVTYEVLDEPYEDRIKVVASTTGGSTWNVPESMNTIPGYIDRVEEPYGYVSYWEGAERVYAPMAYTPVIVGLDGSGFMYLNTFTRSVPYQVNDKLWVFLSAPDLVYGINPQSDWTGNTLRDVIDLAVGDTDSDGRREVVVGFHNQVGVYEMKSSTDGSGFMTYEEAWLSREYDNPVTGVTIFDSNSNGWDDIGISTERGDVYFIEYIDVSEGAVELKGSKVNWSAQTTGYGIYAGWDSLHSYDLDNDGKEEVICVQLSPADAYALDDDGTLLWNFTDGVDGYYDSMLADLTNDSIPEVILASRNGTLHVVDIQDGHEVWHYSNPTTTLFSVDVGDLENDSENEVVFTTTGGDIWVLHQNGSFYHRWTPSSGQLYDAHIANLTGGSILDVAYVANNGSINVINPLNGTILYVGPAGMVIPGARIDSHDFNDDGIEDIVYGKHAGHILDVTTGIVFYNTSDWNSIWGMYVEDFDNDNSVEILGYSNDGDIYLEEPDTGSLQWHYAPLDSGLHLVDIHIGYLGGSGKYDIVAGFTSSLSSDDGVAVAIDGKNGIPIWFNATGGYLTSMGTADIHGNGIDTLIAWDYMHNMTYAIDGYTRIPPEEDEAYPMHELYWNSTISEANVGGTRVADLNADGLDEIVMWDTNKTVWILNGTNGAVIWNRQLAAEISDISIGDLNGDAWLDLAVQGTDHKVYALSGVAGSTLGIVSAPTGWKVLDTFVGGFNSGNPYEEMAIAFTGPSETYTAWYDGSGIELYRSSTNLTSSIYAMDIGYILGHTTLDVVLGGANEFAAVYRGYDGQFQWSYNTGGPSIYEIVVGNFTGDAYADLAIKDSSYDIRVVDGSTHGLITTIVTTTTLRGYYAADIHLDDGTDEIVLNLETIGVRAYNSAGTSVWQYTAPLVINSLDSTCVFDDMDGDGHIDLVFTNREYINVVSGATSSLLWHYSIHDHRVVRPQVGSIIDSSGPPDVVSYWGGNVYVVAGVENPPIPPAVPTPAFISPNVWITERVVASITVIAPIVGCIAMIGFVVRKRKEEE